MEDFKRDAVALVTEQGYKPSIGYAFGLAQFGCLSCTHGRCASSTACVSQDPVLEVSGLVESTPSGNFRTLVNGLKTVVL